MLEKLKLPLIYLGVFLFGFASTYLYLNYLSKRDVKISNNQNTFEEINNLFESSQNKQAEESKIFSAVLLGSGGSGHSGGTLTDSIIVVKIDPKNKGARLISIPRDLWVNGNYKINATVHNVGLENLKGVIQNVTGIEVKKYASVDFNSLVKLIDKLGGIEVDLPNSFSDNFYPVKGLENETCGKSGEEIALLHSKYSGFDLEKQFTCRYESISYEKGLTQINGTSALKLARSRHGDSDFGRSQRQFAILFGIIKKLSTQSPFESIEDAYESLVGLVKTDLSLSEAVQLFDVLGNPNDYEIEQINLTDQNVLMASKSSDGQYILIPRSGKNNFESVRSYIENPQN